MPVFWHGFAAHDLSIGVTMFCMNWILRNLLLYNPPSSKWVDALKFLCGEFLSDKVREISFVHFFSFVPSLWSCTLDRVFLFYFLSPSPSLPARFLIVTIFFNLYFFLLKRDVHYFGLLKKMLSEWNSYTFVFESADGFETMILECEYMCPIALPEVWNKVAVCKDQYHPYDKNTEEIRGRD